MLVQVTSTAYARSVSPRKGETMSDRLLDEVKSYLDRFCAFPNEASLDACTLWVAHTHAVDSEGKLLFESTPRLAILSSEPGSGKTRVLEMVESLSHNGIRVTDPTGPALVSLVNDERATICIDEIDVLFGTGAGQRPVRAFLNAGYRQGSKIARSGKLSDCFAPVAMAGMGQNFSTNDALRPLYTRSIIVRMKKKSAEQKIDDYRERMHGPIAHGLRDSLTSWGTSHALELATAWPTLPEGVVDRLADVWEPLIAIGETAGPEWAKRASEACRAIALSDVQIDGHLSPTQRLVKALSRVFTGEDALPTATIIERLQALPNSPWEKAWPTPRTAAMELSALLKPLNVAPVKIWVGDRGLQGYRWADIEPHALTFRPSDLPEDSREDILLLD